MWQKEEETLIPELQEIGALRKVLPYGRYLTTFTELEARFAPNDENRTQIWRAFQEVTDILKEVYGRIVAVWFGGSFITSEQTPHVVYLIDGDSYSRAVSEPYGQFVTHVLLRKNPAVSRLNPLVDAYLFPVPPTDTNIHYNYSVSRGYWDQFWSKARFEDGNDRWLYPAAGYLEVIIDGYDK